ncbi:MAG: zinc ribbon domain-containing protein [Anaerolineae bacterium]|nr:zinc ribbon domain-containing protein [Anaerolineae bacterium]
MPIYEYECAVCGLRFERLQRGDAPAPACPAGHRVVRRRFSPPGIIFRGGGFYVTDNRHTQAEDRQSA